MKVEFTVVEAVLKLQREPQASNKSSSAEDIACKLIPARFPGCCSLWGMWGSMKEQAEGRGGGRHQRI